MDDYEPYCTQKVVLLGASDVGKSVSNNYLKLQNKFVLIVCNK